MSIMDMTDDDSLRDVPLNGKLLTLTEDFSVFEKGQVVVFNMDVWGTWFCSAIGVYNQVVGVPPELLEG